MINIVRFISTNVIERNTLNKYSIYMLSKKQQNNDNVNNLFDTCVPERRSHC